MALFLMNNSAIYDGQIVKVMAAMEPKEIQQMMSS